MSWLAICALSVSLPHDGNCFSGAVETVEFCSPGQDEPLLVSWWLALRDQPIVSDMFTLPIGETQVIRLETPTVSAPLVLQLRVSARGASDIGPAEMVLPIWIYPKTSPGSRFSGTAAADVAVCDGFGDLADVIEARGGSVIRLCRAELLGTLRPRLILIGPNQLTGRLMERPALLHLIWRGATAIVFRQPNDRWKSGIGPADRCNNMAVHRLSSWWRKFESLAEQTLITSREWYFQHGRAGIIQFRRYGLGWLICCDGAFDATDPRDHILLTELLDLARRLAAAPNASFLSAIESPGLTTLTVQPSRIDP